MSPDNLCATHVNDFAWNSEGTHCVLVFPWESKPHANQKANQVTIVRAENFPKIFVRRLIESRPHTKDVTCVSYIPNSNQFVTSGLDKQVVHWNAEEKKASFNILHTLHTSVVNALCAHSGRDLIFSGGSDRKIISYSLKSNSIVNSCLTKVTGKICSIKENPSHSDFLLLW